MSIKINKLELENVKRIRAVKIEPSANGLTVIGGRNNQGKTSVIDSIAWVLGGEKYRPGNAQADDSVIPPNLHIVLSNGMIVERKGKNSTLTVTDPAGNKGGQQLLNEFIEQLALDLPKFMQSNNKDKANVLLQIVGVGRQLAELELKEKEIYNERQAIGRIADQKAKYAKEQPYYPDAPKEPVSASELIRQQQDILAKNGENQRKRDHLASLKRSETMLQLQVDDATQKLKELQDKLHAVSDDIVIAQTDVLDLQDQSTEELERNIENIDTINRKVRANLDKDKAEEDARNYTVQYEEMTTNLNDVREQKMALLDNAALPLTGLSIAEGELIYNGHKWDCLSGSDQLKVATAIVRKLNPQCGFVLLDKLEQMDIDTMNEFGVWLEAEGLQAIATRVSTGGECQVIIEDGYVKDTSEEPTAVKPAWKAGEF